MQKFELREGWFPALSIIPAAVAAAGRMRSRSASTIYTALDGSSTGGCLQLHLPPIIQSTYRIVSAQTRIPAKISKQQLRVRNGNYFMISSISNRSHLSHMIHESWILTSLKPEWWTGARFSCFSTESWACLFRHFSHLSWYRYPAAGRGAGGGPGGPQHRQNCKWDEIVGIWSKYSENRGGTPRGIADKMLVVP